MRRWIGTVFVLFGAITGTVIGENLSNVLPWLDFGADLGFKTPMMLDFYILDFTFGFSIYINLAGIIGLALFAAIAVKLFKWPK